jgi:GNAT superfamily N-acetyltransferase
MPCAIRIAPVTSTHDLHRFVLLPESINPRPNFVPPVWSDEFAFHDPDKNPGLNQCDILRLLAFDGDRIVGRIMGIIHREYNERKQERTGRFYQLETVNDPAVAHALLEAVRTWCREKGMDRLIGPFGLSDKDPQGAQIEGFEHLPVIATATNPDYLPQLLNAEGFIKLVDCLVYRLDIPDSVPDLYQRIAARTLRNGRLRVLSFSKRRELKPFIVPVLRLVNETYRELLGFQPMTEAEMRKLAAQYLPLLVPELVKMIVDEHAAPVAFIIAVPDFSEGLRKARGRLFPLGFLYVLSAMRKSRQLDLLLGAVRPDYQGRGLTAVLGLNLFDSARRHKLHYIDSHLILETNMRMRAEMERLGSVVYKRYRVYEQKL